MNKFYFIIFLFIAQFFIADLVSAGFGVSPPYISSSKIRPGVVYKQMINVLRSSAEDSLEIELSVDAPEIANWISFDESDIIIMPEGTYNMPIEISIDIPDTADLGNYQGKIILKTKPIGGKNSLISFSTGAEINIDFDLSDNIYNELLVQDASMTDYEIGGDFLSKLSVVKKFRPLKVDLTIENIGNIKGAPTKVALDIYNINETELLLSVSDTKLDTINAFETINLQASYSVDLLEGQYWGKVKVYNSNKIIYNNKLAFSVVSVETPKIIQIIVYLVIGFILLTATALVTLKIRSIRKSK